jgi:hypothetical protein
LTAEQRSEAELAIAAALQAAAAAAGAGAGAAGAAVGRLGGLRISSCKLTGAGRDSAAILQALPGSTLTSLDSGLKVPYSSPSLLPLEEAAATWGGIGSALPRLQQLRELRLDNSGTFFNNVDCRADAAVAERVEQLGAAGAERGGVITTCTVVQRTEWPSEKAQKSRGYVLCSSTTLQDACKTKVASKAFNVWHSQQDLASCSISAKPHCHCVACR